MTADELREAIRDGEVERVADRLVSASEKERRALAKAIGEEAEKWRWDRNDKHARRRRAALVAWAGTATAREVASEAWLLIGGELHIDDRVYELLASRGRGYMENLARMLLRQEIWWTWFLVRRAVREGMIEPPEGEGYLAGMIAMVGGLHGHDQLDSVHRGLLEDPELIEEVWHLFEHDLGGALANTKEWHYEADHQYSRGENRWTYALVSLAGEGMLDRGRLLDASLDALMRDFRPSGIAWYAQLHEALEPTAEERAERLDRYLGLVASPAAAALKAGLAGLKALGDGVPADELARAAPAALAQPQKTHAINVLRLLEEAAKRDELGRPTLLGAAAHALAHERADVQERALKLIERYPDAAPRAELLAYVDTVSPTLRARVEQLTGVSTGSEAIPAPALDELEREAAVSVREGRWPEPRMPEPQPGPPLTPVESVDELIELGAALVEGQGSGDDAERFLDGVSRLCDERPRRFEQRTEGLAKSTQLPPAWATWAAEELVSGQELVAVLVQAWTRRRKPRAKTPERTIGGLMSARVLEVATRAAKRKPRELLSFPTHSGGRLDPEALREREQRAGRILNRPDPADQAVAHLRTLAGPTVELEAERTLGSVRWDGQPPPKRIGFEIGSMPPGLAEVRAVADSLSSLGRDSVDWYFDDRVWPVADELGARWVSTLLPGHPEVQFARALTSIADFVDGSVYRHPEVVLEQMLDPDVPLRDPAWTTLAAALVAKSPDVQRVAADVVVTSIADGRFDPDRLGTGLAWLLEGGFGTITRVEAPLRDAARVSPLHAAQVARAMEAFAARCPEGQRNLHAPLGLALELAAGARLEVTAPEARAALERIAESASRSSKLGKAARGLLELRRDDSSYDAILRLAAAATA